MMILKMNHMCHLLGLILMKKAWRVLAAVAAGDEETEEEVEEEGGGDDDDEGEEETYVVSDTPESRLEGEDQLQGQDRLGEGKKKGKSNAC
jgi:hypothetical protein